MKHETPTITATRRDRMGTRYSGRLRKAGRLPAVIYGHKTAPVAVSIDAKETLTHLRHGLHVVNLAIEGDKPETCLVKELQFGYLGDNVIHIDFARVNLDEEVDVKVHLRFIGSPESAKAAGAVLNYDLTDLEVRCKVRDIPEEIKVDLSSMPDVLTVGQLTLPQGVEAATDANRIVAHVGFVAEEVVAAEAAPVEAGAAAPVEPVVMSELKAEERQKAKESSEA